MIKANTAIARLNAEAPSDRQHRRPLAVNEALADQPELVNSDPYGTGWMFEIELTDPAASAGPISSIASPASASRGSEARM